SRLRPRCPEPDDPHAAALRSRAAAGRLTRRRRGGQRLRPAARPRRDALGGPVGPPLATRRAAAPQLLRARVHADGHDPARADLATFAARARQPPKGLRARTAWRLTPQPGGRRMATRSKTVRPTGHGGIPPSGEDGGADDRYSVGLTTLAAPDSMRFLSSQMR